MSNYKMSFADALYLAIEIRERSRDNAARLVAEIAESAYRLGYMAAKAEAINKPAIKEIAPGMFAVTLDNPEDLFRLLDDIERYEKTGDIPCNENANIIAALKGEPPYFV